MNKQPHPDRLEDDNPEWTEADFNAAETFSSLPSSLQAKLRGRPKGSGKTQITLRVDNETLAAFRALGDGWQTRMNEVLTNWAREHSS